MFERSYGNKRIFIGFDEVSYNSITNIKESVNQVHIFLKGLEDLDWIKRLIDFKKVNNLKFKITIFATKHDYKYIRMRLFSYNQNKYYKIQGGKYHSFKVGSNDLMIIHNDIIRIGYAITYYYYKKDVHINYNFKYIPKCPKWELS